MIRGTLRPVSSFSDFSFTNRLVSDDGEALWGDTIPADLVLSFKLLPETNHQFSSDYGREWAFGTPVIEGASNDGLGLITALINGYFDIAIPKERMRALAPDNLYSARRYRLFVNTASGDGATQQLVATIPVYRGE